MVLQNKYKARASRRYKAAKGISDTPNARATPSEELGVSAAGREDSSSAPADVEERQFHRYPLKSNDWRYEESESDEEAEPEPAIDSTKLQEKVLALDIDARVQGEVPGSDEESEEEWTDPSSRKAQLQVLKNVDWEAIQREKQNSEAARELKERFQRQARVGHTAATWRRVEGSQVSVPQKARKNRAPAQETAPRVSAADRMQTAQGSKASVRFVPRPTAAQTGSSAQDIDDFLRDIHASDPMTGPSSHVSERASTAPMNNDMQDFLDGVLG